MENKFVKSIIGDIRPYISKLSPSFTTTNDKVTPLDENPRKHKYIRIGVRRSGNDKSR